MKAIIGRTYGGPEVLEVAEVETPVPGDADVLIRVRAASVNRGDWLVLRGEPYLLRLAGGLRRPRIVIRGRDVAGVVEAVGRNVTRFRPGDAVYAEVETGSFAEYACGPQDVVAPMPAGVSFAQAAAIPVAGGAALQALRDAGRLQPGQRVLVNGASGGFGTFAVQIAGALGAEVTGVCGAGGVELVRSLGAHHVVDRDHEDVTAHRHRYDVILDLVADRPLAVFRRMLVPGGTLVVASGNGGRWLGPLGRMAGALALSPFVGRRLRPFSAHLSGEDLAVLAGLVESGAVMPVVTRVFALDEAAKAMRLLGDGRARGKIVLTVDES